jgi:hypothetical protein
MGLCTNYLCIAYFSHDRLKAKAIDDQILAWT